MKHFFASLLLLSSSVFTGVIDSAEKYIIPTEQSVRNAEQAPVIISILNEILVKNELNFNSIFPDQFDKNVQQISNIIQNSLDKVYKLSDKTNPTGKEVYISRIQNQVATQEFRNSLAQSLGKHEKDVDTEMEVFKALVDVDARKVYLSQKITKMKSLDSQGRIMDAFQKKTRDQRFRDLLINMKGAQVANDYMRGTKYAVITVIKDIDAKKITARMDLSIAEVKLAEAEARAHSALDKVDMDDKFIRSTIKALSNEITASQMLTNLKKSSATADFASISHSANNLKNVEDQDVKAAEILLMLGDDSGH